LTFALNIEACFKISGNVQAFAAVGFDAVSARPQMPG